MGTEQLGARSMCWRRDKSSKVECLSETSSSGPGNQNRSCISDRCITSLDAPWIIHHSIKKVSWDGLGVEED